MEDVEERIEAFCDAEGGKMMLMLGPGSAKSVDMYDALEREEFAADEPVCPSWLDAEASAEQFGAAPGIGAAEEDDPGDPLCWL